MNLHWLVLTSTIDRAEDRRVLIETGSLSALRADGRNTVVFAGGEMFVVTETIDEIIDRLAQPSTPYRGAHD